MPLFILIVFAVLAMPATGFAQRKSAGSSGPNPPAGIAVTTPPWSGHSNPPAGIAVATPPLFAVATPPRRHAVPRQTISPRSGPASEGWPQDPLPNWSSKPHHHRRVIAGLPLPQIGLPLPPIGLQPHVEWNKYGRPHRGRSYAPWYAWPVVYAVPQVVDPYPQTAPAPLPAVIEQAPQTGRLILEVEPRTAQVFADGFYVGTPDDFSADRGGLLLESGAHRIDLIMPGHEQMSFDVRIAPNQFITYRHVLKPFKVEPIPAPAARSAPTTFYLIPGCYMGNVPPKEAKLRPTCDPDRAITFQQ